MIVKRIPLVDATASGGCGTDSLRDFEDDVPRLSDSSQTNVLGLNITMQCPLRCDFCCYACHPKRTERMELSLALDVVEQAAALGVFSAVGFTGGEPFLMYDELLSIGDALARHRLPFNIVSAGHWAADPEDADRMVGALAERGMYKLSLSTDPSHARFVPPQSVVNAARAASMLGLAVDVQGAFAEPGDTIEAFVPDLVDLPGVTMQTGSIAPAGRGRKLNAAASNDLGFQADGLRCYRPVYHDIIVFWDGATYPCCSVFNREADGIVLGNAYEDSLQTLWERAEGSILLRTMKRVGFQHLYTIVEELDPALHRRLPPIDPAGGPCRLCSEIFSDLDLARDIRNTFVVYEQRTIEALLSSLEDEFGATEAASIVNSALNARRIDP